MAPTGPLASRGISRQHLLLETVAGQSLRVTNIGSCPLLVDGTARDEVTIEPGTCLVLRRQMALLYLVQPRTLPRVEAWDAANSPEFGRADRFGLVGEGPAAWSLRGRLAFCGSQGLHTLITGESGTGKELAARAIHALSARADRRLISRSAATIPGSLMDAELFGNARNYPNPGMAEREGLIGAADRSVLFLDEIGELPAELQARLLRVLDAGGEYQRLGETRLRRADLRLVAATNRDVSDLKHDLTARLTLRVNVPSLNERPEDIPLLIRHLLHQPPAGSSVPERFVDRDGAVRVNPDLVAALVTHTFTTHVRELTQLLWAAVASSAGDKLRLTEEVKQALGPRDASALPGPELTPERILEAIAANDGNRTRAARALGLSSRHVLKRLIKKLALEVPET